MVAKDQADGIITNELFTDDEGLRQAIGTKLEGVDEIIAEQAAATQQSLERNLVSQRGDDKDIADASEHG